LSYATLMVHLQVGPPNAGLLAVACGLAETFQAHLIGIAVCRPAPMIYGDGALDGALIERERKELMRELKQTEAEFRRGPAGRLPSIEWRSDLLFSSLAGHLAAEARACDLVIASAGQDNDLDFARAADGGDLLMQIGRPVLMVPAGAAPLRLERVVVAWKDTREARRAISSALPMLGKSRHVIVAEIAPAQELAAARLRLADVVGWLGRHHVMAQALASPATGDDASALRGLLRAEGSDLLVAGAYGHSRLREWALGGVTRDLLLRGECCALVTH
jgi:nucleotide-binding universal stress UspA family protein